MNYMKLLNHVEAYFLLLFIQLKLIDSANLNSAKHPNIVMLIADDLGIGDLGCFGNDTIKTPNIDRLAVDGVTLRHHLAVSSLCTPSRAALLTGRYPFRYGMEGSEDTPPVVVHVASRVGLPSSETTLADVLFASGYTTAFVGKWHLGSGCSWFGSHCLGPLLHGFQHFFGLPFTLTSSMEGTPTFWVFHLQDPFYQSLIVTLVLVVLSSGFLRKINHHGLALALCLLSLTAIPCAWFLYSHYRLHTPTWWRISPWMEKHLNGVVMRNGQVVHQWVPFESIERELTAESVQFIRHSAKNRLRPFFLVHSFLHVHTPMYASEEHSGRSAHGRYGDNVEEMDTAVGQIVEALKEENLEEETLVYFVSDHGGHLEAVDPKDGQRIGGFNKNFKGGKGMGAPEGGIRVPGIVRWKGVLPPKSYIDTPTSLLDMFPTLLHLTDVPSPPVGIGKPGNPLDGVSFGDLLKNPTVKDDRRRILIHHCRNQIHGLRLFTGSQVYKMYLYLHRWEPNSTQCGWGDVLCSCFGDSVTDVVKSPVLFELTTDPFEDSPIDNTLSEYKDVVDELMTFLEEWEAAEPYPPSQYASKLDTILSPWLQPFKYLT